jgi:UDP-N-acetylmuramate--alanine ligase
VIDEVRDEARPGDLIMTIGAGSVWKIGEALAQAINSRLAREGGVTR